jgi:hypothetical protein
VRRRLKQEADQPRQFDRDTLELEETVYERGDNGRIRPSETRRHAGLDPQRSIVAFVTSIPAKPPDFPEEIRPNRHKGRARLRSRTPAPAC